MIVHGSLKNVEPVSLKLLRLQYMAAQYWRPRRAHSDLELTMEEVAEDTGLVDSRPVVITSLNGHPGVPGLVGLERNTGRS
jgi:hypothetical protein